MISEEAFFFKITRKAVSKSTKLNSSLEWEVEEEKLALILIVFSIYFKFMFFGSSTELKATAIGCKDRSSSGCKLI